MPDDGRMTNTQQIIDSIRTGSWTQAAIGVNALEVLAAEQGDQLAIDWLTRYAPWAR